MVWLCCPGNDGESIRGTSSRAIRHGTLGHSRLSSLSHCGLILAQRVELVWRELISTLEKKKTAQAGIDSSSKKYFPKILVCEEKATIVINWLINTLIWLTVGRLDLTDRLGDGDCFIYTFLLATLLFVSLLCFQNSICYCVNSEEMTSYIQRPLEECHVYCDTEPYRCGGDRNRVSVYSKWFRPVLT